MIRKIKLAILFFAFIFFFGSLFGQDRGQFPIVVSVFNSGSQLPGTGTLGIFTSPIHPGISIGSEYTYNFHPSHQWFQTANLGYFFHQYAQHGIQLYSEIGYRYWFKNGFHFGPLLGIGYLHSIPDTDIFKLDSQGKYQKKTNLGRPQFLADFAFNIGYQFSKENPFSIFMKYQTFFQMPFVNKYVPILPNTALHIGFTFNPFVKHEK